MTIDAISDATHRSESDAGFDHSGNGRHHQVAPEPVPVNVASGERLVSAIAGVPLVVAGLRMRSLKGLAVAFIGAGLVNRALTGNCPAYSALGVNRARGKGAQPSEYFQRGVHITQSVTIDKPVGELYQFWKNFENLPRIMSHLRSVKTIDDRRSRWIADAPAGLTVQWEAEIINDVRDDTIAWRSLYPATVDNAGSVRFVEAPAGRGTEVTVTLDYIPPAGNFGWIIAKLFGADPNAQIREDLRRFKHIMETGEVPTIEGQPHGRRSVVGSVLAGD